MSESENLPETQDAQDVQTQDDDAFGITSAATGEIDTKELEVADESHPLAQETGKTGSIQRKMDEEAIHEYLADLIYDSNSAFVREFLQNSETACIRAAKVLLAHHDDYGEEWLTVTKWVNAETGDTIASDAGATRQAILAEYEVADENLRRIEVPRSLSEVVEAARDVGYDPTIEVDVHREERKIVWRDNGIGMTAHEADKAYNTTGLSGVRDDSETGGKMGMGALTFKNMTGKDGEMIAYTGTRRPDADGHNAEPFAFAAYLGGMDPLPNEVPDDFRGSRFEIPVQDSVELGQFQDWMESYSQMLRVPVLYKEHREGRTTVEEEYGGTTLLERYDDPPVQIHRPGEFSVVAGPDVRSVYGSEPDTFLVSMKIDRNTGQRVNSFWNAVVQIHDEQGKVVSGPHRGMRRDEVETLHDNDVITPEPTADRDRLQKDSYAKEFFNYVSSEVKAEEMEAVGEVAEEMYEADNPWETIKGDTDSWNLFRKMVDYHGPYNVLESKRKFTDFVNDRDVFPDYDDDTLEQIYSLFREIEHADEDRWGNIPTKKSDRDEKKLGSLLAEHDASQVYMAASTSGAFVDRYKVVDNTHDDGTVIVVGSTAKYDPYQQKFGFSLLKEVPRTQSDEHDFDVPDDVHESNVRKPTTDGGNDSPETVEERTLKIRCDSANKSIDKRLTIEEVHERLEGKRGNLGGHQRLVLFSRGGSGENISDNYDVQKFAAISAATKAEQEALLDLSNVMMFEEFVEWSESTVIATEDGPMTPHELLEDDRMVVLAYADGRERKFLLKDDDEKARLREFYAKDARDQLYWGSDDKKDTLLAVADNATLKRAEYAFHSHTSLVSNEDVLGLRLSTSRYRGKVPFSWKRLSGDRSLYQQKAATPEWDNDSDVYDLMPSSRGGVIESLLFGLHDAGIIPTEASEEALRQMAEKGGRKVLEDHGWNPHDA